MRTTLSTPAWLPPLALLAGLAACGPRFDPEACTEAVISQGFGLRWAELDHRISQWGLGLRGPEGEPARCGAEALEARYVGGDFTTGSGVQQDTPWVRLGFQRFSAPSPEVAGFARVEVPLTIEGGGGWSCGEPLPRGLTSLEGWASTTLTLRRADLALRGYPKIEALISGLTLRSDVPQGPAYPSATYDPALGFTSRGLGAELQVVSLDAEEITLKASLRVEPGCSVDRADHDAALPFARYEGQLELLLVGHDAPVTRGGVAYRLEYPDPSPPEIQEIPPAAPDLQSMGLRGRPGGGLGVFGFTRFNLALDPWDPAQAGYYLKALDASATLERFHNATGRLDLLVNGYASNAGVFAWQAMNNTFSATLVWVQLPGEGEPQVLEQAFTTGAATLPLP